MTFPVITVNPDTSVQDVAGLLGRRRISGVVVADEDGRAIGVVTEADLIQRLAHPHLPPHVEILGAVIYLQMPGRIEELMRKMMGSTARAIMSGHLVTAEPATPVASVADLMVEHDIRRVVIVEDERPVGIVTRGDLIRRLLAGIERVG